MISIDDSDPVPVFEQVRSQIAAQILTGALQVDQNLPTVRQLARDLRIAPGTVARAYQLLESEGLVTTGRRAGTRVSIDADQYPDVLDSALGYADAARARGLTLEQAVFALNAAWNTGPERRRRRERDARSGEDAR
ncbi:GntR family transcriptional regulator [Planctomonas sp. JC2975]|uniref:GntR family transcriptional regulator n=1 Tax=Planctomonas sp. JC2975 TaxID=2729626 RepID=UPI0014754103|nr:GntR family transcriptional regulator [Planctomonas sp. JC2975]